MSQLLDFYRCKGTDSEGRRLAEIWNWPDEELELVHDYIQWLFPLQEPSRFNMHAPLMTAADKSEFNRDPAIQANLRQSYVRILAFFGLSRHESGAVEEGPNFSNRAEDVWRFPNHNWLRITRILKCLCLAGLKDEARQFYAWLETACSSRRFPIPAETFDYWTDAVR